MALTARLLQPLALLQLLRLFKMSARAADRAASMAGPKDRLRRQPHAAALKPTAIQSPHKKLGAEKSEMLPRCQAKQLQEHLLSPGLTVQCSYSFWGSNVETRHGMRPSDCWAEVWLSHPDLEQRAPAPLDSTNLSKQSDLPKYHICWKTWHQRMPFVGRSILAFKKWHATFHVMGTVPQCQNIPKTWKQFVYHIDMFWLSVLAALSRQSVTSRTITFCHMFKNTSSLQ